MKKEVISRIVEHVAQLPKSEILDENAIAILLEISPLLSDEDIQLFASHRMARFVYQETTQFPDNVKIVNYFVLWSSR